MGGASRAARFGVFEWGGRGPRLVGLASPVVVRLFAGSERFRYCARPPTHTAVRGRIRPSVILLGGILACWVFGGRVPPQQFGWDGLHLVGVLLLRCSGLCVPGPERRIGSSISRESIRLWFKNDPLRRRLPCRTCRVEGRLPLPCGRRIGLVGGVNPGADGCAAVERQDRIRDGNEPPRGECSDPPRLWLTGEKPRGGSERRALLTTRPQSPASHVRTTLCDRTIRLARPPRHLLVTGIMLGAISL